MMSLLAGFIVPHPPIIIPDIGQGEERKISKTIAAYREISKMIADLQPSTIIFFTPHHLMYHDYFHISPGLEARGTLEQFNSLETFKVDYHPYFIETFNRMFPDFPAGAKGETKSTLDHGVMVPLYFIQQYYQDFKVIRVSLSGLSLEMHETFGRHLNDVMLSMKEDYVIVASGDLSHKLKFSGPYGYVEEGPVFDQMVTQYMSQGDFKKMMAIPPKIYHRAAECGLRGFIMLGGALMHHKYRSRLIHYEGQFGVGYAVASFVTIDPYVTLAKNTLETYLKVKDSDQMSMDVPNEMLEGKAGVFVSIKKNGHLRGCIGTIYPTTENIKNEIIQNTFSAAFKDPRFPEISKGELNDLTYSVDILKEPVKVISLDELDVNKYGVIVKKGYRSGLLLPNLEGVNTIQHQIDIALSKARISPDEEFEIFKFEVIRHK
jgi:AmmeMemoRadiSam system protein A